MDEEKEKALTRREFLVWLAAATAMLALPGCDPNSPQAGAAAPRLGGPAPDGGMAYASTTWEPLSHHNIVIPDPPPAIITDGRGYTTVSQTYQPAPTQHYVQPTATYAQPAPVYTQPVQAYAQTTPTYVQASYAQPAPSLSATQLRVQPVRQPPAPRPSAPRPAAPQRGAKVSAVSRNSWAVTPANPAKMKRMGAVKRITIHHEGSAKPNNDSTAAQVAATLRLIQSQHHKRMGAGDIGYHFIIDRTGTIWQGRDWAYQGAHTSGANANNIGVMLLGNFEIQKPTSAQIGSLNSLVISLVRRYGLNPRADIYGHSDFCNTQCPGKNLKGHVQLLRVGIKL